MRASREVEGERGSCTGREKEGRAERGRRGAAAGAAECVLNISPLWVARQKTHEDEKIHNAQESALEQEQEQEQEQGTDVCPELHAAMEQADGGVKQRQLTVV